MNTRQAIQPSDNSVVLSVAFSQASNRFVAALSNGIRAFRSDNCQTTCRPESLPNGGFAIAEILDDRYLAWAGGGRVSSSSPNVVVFWDAVLNKEITRHDFHEPVVGVRLHSKWMLVLLNERAALFQYQRLAQKQHPPPGKTTLNDDQDLVGPNKVVSVINTSANPFAIGCVHEDFMILPATITGQVQVVSLREGTSRRVHRAHNSQLQCIAVSPDGSLFATASVQGTLLRVFDSVTLDQIAEFRRGVDVAIVFNMAFSITNRWLACTSDKGTIHVFDLRPPSPTETSRRKSNPVAPRVAALNRYSDASSINSSDPPSPSTITGYQGSIQEYYGLRPPPPSALHTSHSQGAPVSALAAMRASPLAPRIFRDVRSIASATFSMGEDAVYWQGGPSTLWTTAPNGTRRRIKQPVPARPGNPAGKPPKGILAFEHPCEVTTDDAGTLVADDSATLYVIGGGSDARWERFDLVPANNHNGWALIRRGFRKYLTRQFAE